MQNIILDEHTLPTTAQLENSEYCIKWICNTLGVGTGRDTERIAPQILQLLIQNNKSEGMKADAIAQEIDVETQRALYHIRGLISAGILQRNGKYIQLRQPTITQTIIELRRDSERIFENLMHVGEVIDAEQIKETN